MKDDRGSVQICTSRVGRVGLVGIGSVLLGIGLIGIVVPVLPTTPFLLAAAVCYARGSRRCYRWLLANRYFGRHLEDYLEGRGVSWRVRAGALVFLWVAILVSTLFLVEALWLRIFLVLVAVAVTAHLVTLRGIRWARGLPRRSDCVEVPTGAEVTDEVGCPGIGYPGADEGADPRKPRAE